MHLVSKWWLFGSFVILTILGCKKSDTFVPPVTEPVVKTTFSNPLLPTGPDPWILKKDSFYYYTDTDGDKIRIWKTKEISQLSSAPSKIIWTKPLTGPNSQHVWAPELHYLDGKWYMYYAAGATIDQNNQRLFVLENTSEDPTQGTWVDKGGVRDAAADFWAIDATIFEHNGNRYILWSGYASATDFVQRIYIARLQTPWSLATGRSLISSPTYSWEMIGAPPPVNEAPEILRNAAGKIFIVFSASGCWTDSYSMGVLALKDGGNPLSATDWEKTSSPVFTTKAENQAYGPGHCAFFKSPDGTEDWMIYHANSGPNQGCGDTRSPRIQKFSWNPDGTPNFGEPVKINTPIARPAGEVK